MERECSVILGNLRNTRDRFCRGRLIEAARLLALVVYGLTVAGDLHADEGGYFRVVNAGKAPSNYRFTVRLHGSPWFKWNVAFSESKDETVQPGDATAWVCLPDIVERKPVTIQVFTWRQSPEKNMGRVEFASAASPDAVLRGLDMNGKELTVELSEVAFRDASQIRTAAEIGAATLALVRTMTFRGKRPDVFPTGYAGGTEDDFRAGRLLGFTAVHVGPTGISRKLFELLGYRHIYGFSNWLQRWDMGGGYNREKNDVHTQQLAAKWREAQLLDFVRRVSVRDEPMLDVKDWPEGGLADMHKDPPFWKRLIDYAGYQPEDFIHADDPPPPGLDPMSEEYWKHLKGWTTASREDNPEGVYRTMRMGQIYWPCRFRIISDSVRASLGERVLTTANIHWTAYFRDNLSGLDPWMMYSRRQAVDVPQVCDYMVSWPQQEEWLIDIQRCALRPHNHKPVDAMLQAQSSYFPRPPLHLKMCALSAIGAGARSLTFYEWGPRYIATENWYASDPERLRAIGEINHAVGWAEDILLAGAPRPARVAIMYSRPSDMWDRLAPAEAIDKPQTYLTERRILYHLLRGLQRQVDFINDEVLPAEQGVDIDQYKVIFISQRCITAKGAQVLLEWVERGGTLIGIVSIGQLDGLERPWDQMLKAFGLSSISVAFKPDPETRQIEGSGVQARRMFADIGVADAAVRSRFEDGSPAVTEKSLGAGKLIYAAWAPGWSYHRGVRSTDDLRLLLGMPDDVRKVVAEWIEPAGAPICATDHPLISARLIESPAGAVVVLVNSSGKRDLPRVRVSVSDTEATRAGSLQHGHLTAQRMGGSLHFELPLDLTDVVRLD